MKVRLLQIATLIALILLFSLTYVKAATITSTAAGGDWAVTTTWVGNVVPLTTDNVVIATTGAGEVTTPTSSTTITCASLTINSGATLTMWRPLTVSGVTSISGTINFAASGGTARAMTFTGDVTLNSGAAWNEPASGNGSNNTYGFVGNFTNNSTTFNALGTGIHTFTGTSRTIGGSTITSIGSVTVTGSRTNSGTFTVRTSLAGSGNLTNGNGTTGTLNIGVAISITTLTATAANNLVNYTGTAQTAKVTTYNNLTLSGSLAKTFATTPTVNRVLSIEGTATVVVTTGVVTYGANATLQYNTATSRTTSSEEWLTTFAATGGVIIAGTGIIIMNEAKVFNASIPLTINSGATLNTKAANSYTLTLGGNFVNNGGTFTAYASPIVIANTMTTQSIAGFTTTGTVSLTKSAGTATFLGNVNGGPLTINGSGTGILNLGIGLNHTFNGDINFLGGSLNGGNSTLNENNLSSTAFNGNTNLFIAGTGTVNFGGPSQSIAGTGTPTFNNLTVSNTSTKTFTNVPVVNGVFTIAGTATVSAAPTYGPAATLQYNTATSRTAGVEWITPFVASGGVIIANTGTITMNIAKVFNSTVPLTVNSGSSFSMSTYLLTLNGNFVNNGGTASGTTGGVTITGNATQNIGAFTTTGTVSMTKTGGTATLTGNVNGAGLTINGSGGTLNLGTALIHTFGGDVTLTAGSLNGGSSTLNENASSTTAWSGTGSVFTPASGTVNFGASGNQTIAANSSFFDLALSGSGNKTFTNATAVTNNFTIRGTAKADLGTYTHSANSLTFGVTNQPGGSWGSTASAATHKDDAYFLSTATGVLNTTCIVPSPAASGGTQTICAGETIPSLSVGVNSGETADWYSQESGGTLLATGTFAYTPGGAGTYYAQSRVIATGCLSTEAVSKEV